MDTDEILARLDEIDEIFEDDESNTFSSPVPSQVSENKDGRPDVESHTQWALGANGRFIPVGATIKALTPGIYEPFSTPGSWGLEKMTVSSDDIYILPDMATSTVLAEVNTFWSNEALYRKHKLLYKRGIILHGPPGGGKSVTIKLLMNELVKREGIVILTNSVQLTLLCMKAVRRIEPKRNLIVVFEDIDEIIAQQGEASVLSILDGENNVDNVLHVASTNYPERLGGRIINRPSRFDRRVFVGLPGPEARKHYLLKTTGDALSVDEITRWTADTEDLSIAHLRELVAAVYCLGQPYEEVLDRLKNMTIPVKPDEDFKRKGVGFARGASNGRY